MLTGTAGPSIVKSLVWNKIYVFKCYGKSSSIVMKVVKRPSEDAEFENHFSFNQVTGTSPNTTTATTKS